MQSYAWMQKVQRRVTDWSRRSLDLGLALLSSDVKMVHNRWQNLSVEWIEEICENNCFLIKAILQDVMGEEKFTFHFFFSWYILCNDPCCHCILSPQCIVLGTLRNMEYCTHYTICPPIQYHSISFTGIPVKEK